MLHQTLGCAVTGQLKSPADRQVSVFGYRDSRASGIHSVLLKQYLLYDLSCLSSCLGLCPVSLQHPEFCEKLMSYSRLSELKSILYRTLMISEVEREVWCWHMH